MEEDNKYPEVKISDWLITLFVTAIPVIGFIMLVIWAFDKGTNPSKANWAKSQLVFFIIGIGFFIFIISLVGMSAIMGFFLEGSEDYYSI